MSLEGCALKKNGMMHIRRLSTNETQNRIKGKLRTPIKVQHENCIKVKFETHIESGLNFLVLRGFYCIPYLSNIHHAQAPTLTHISHLHSLKAKNAQNLQL